MVIRRHNFVVTMENSVVTLIEKLLKKNVVILVCSVATMIRQIDGAWSRPISSPKRDRKPMFNYYFYYY